MEEAIYTQLIARLKSADALAYYTAESVNAPKTYEWFTNQVEQALAAVSEENNNAPFDCPALFFEFAPTEYTKGNTIQQDAKGEFTIHLAQFNFVDGREGALTHADFKVLLAYADIIIDLLSGYRLTCTATPILASIERDHTGRALLCDKIKFTWSGRRTRAGIPVAP